MIASIQLGLECLLNQIISIRSIDVVVSKYAATSFNFYFSHTFFFVNWWYLCEPSHLHFISFAGLLAVMLLCDFSGCFRAHSTHLRVTPFHFT